MCAGFVICGTLMSNISISFVFVRICWRGWLLLHTDLMLSIILDKLLPSKMLFNNTSCIISEKAYPSHCSSDLSHFCKIVYNSLYITGADDTHAQTDLMHYDFCYLCPQKGILIRTGIFANISLCGNPFTWLYYMCFYGRTGPMRWAGVLHLTYQWDTHASLYYQHGFCSLFAKCKDRNET